MNRADLLQRQGFYPPPPGASDILGLECSGVISEVGEGVTGWSVGDEVCALLAGGGYAERVAVPAGQLLPRPAGVELATAAALPEVTCTVWSNVFLLAGLRRGRQLPGARRLQRHRHHGDPARRARRRAGVHHRRHRRQARPSAASSAPT